MRRRRPIRAPERAEAPSQGKAVPEQAVERREGSRGAQPRGHANALASGRACPRISNPKP